MKKFYALCLLYILSFDANTSSLNCRVIARSGLDINDYFLLLNDKIDEDKREQLVRKSVSSFYYDEYIPEMSYEAVNTLGEDVAVSYVQDPHGKKYIAVDVGFGGGNSITYYFEIAKLIFAGVASFDGVCLEQGKAPYFI